MANVKNRYNTSKTATNGKGIGKVGRPKKTVNLEMNNTKNTPIQVVKIPRTDKTSEKLHSSRKDKGLLSKLIDKILLNNAELREYIQLPNSNIKKVCNGPIVNKNRHNLKLYDNILKSELMINDNSNTEPERNIETYSNIKVGTNTDKNKETYYTVRKFVPHTDGKTGTGTEKKIDTYTGRKIGTNTDKNIGIYTTRKFRSHTDRKTVTDTDKYIETYAGKKLKTNVDKNVETFTKRKTEIDGKKEKETYKDRTIKKSSEKYNKIHTESKISSNTAKNKQIKPDKRKESVIFANKEKGIQKLIKKKVVINTKKKIITNIDKKRGTNSESISKTRLAANIEEKVDNQINNLNNNDQALTNQNTDNNNTFSSNLFNGLKHSGLTRTKDSKSDCEGNHKKHSGVKKRIRPKKSKQPIDKSIIFQCDLCQRQFHSKCSLRRHIYIHMTYNHNYKCKQCNKGFRKQLYLSAHIRRQHPNWEKHYMCNMCDMPFELKENLIVHLACHTRSETMFKCVYCKEKYSNQKDLFKHEKKHLVSGRYQCIICEMDFDCRNKLTTHFKTHYKVKDFVCQHCGKEFLRMNSMRRHVSICHSGIRIQCPICNKVLKGHLTEHMRTHEKKKPHECSECGQRFTQSTQLNVHRRSHSGARPYPCRICNRPFSHSNALMLHIRRHTGERPFVCAMCPMSFSQLPHMKAHMRNIHGKMNPYRCQKCKQFFKLKIELETHAKSCTVGDKVLSLAEKSKTSVKTNDAAESATSISRMRFLLALLLTKIATKEKLKYLGFNKRLIDDILVESLEGMDRRPCKDESLAPVKRLRKNIEILLDGTVPKDQMEKFKKDNKTPEEVLELLTNENKYN